MATSTASKLPTPMKLLSSWFPNIKHPLIVSAPMRAVSGPELACAVTSAGGLGFIGAGFEYPNLSSELSASRTLLKTPANSPIPIGVGFLTADAPIDAAVSAILEHKPIAVWLSFPRSSSQHKEWISKLQEPGKSWGLKLIVQICNVSDAKEAVEMGADILAVQGCDAGGHGRARSAGLISLLPEVCRMLRDLNLHERIPVVAGGGIVNGTGAAAAITLGAHGIVMGTRFVASDEAMEPQKGYKDATVAATDGGISTLRTNLFDRLRGAIEHWPDIYNGRALLNDTVRDDEKGVSEADNKVKYKEAVEKHDNGRLVVFAGTGVGMVDKVLSAAQIVEETRRGTREALGGVGGILAGIES